MNNIIFSQVIAKNILSQLYTFVEFFQTNLNSAWKKADNVNSKECCSKEEEDKD